MEGNALLSSFLELNSTKISVRNLQVKCTDIVTAYTLRGRKDNLERYFHCCYLH